MAHYLALFYFLGCPLPWESAGIALCSGISQNKKGMLNESPIPVASEMAQMQLERASSWTVTRKKAQDILPTWLA